MAQETASSPVPAGRADGRRNRARVLAAARASFAAEGRIAPLGEIARRAGVGAGTVYRHFPSKKALFEAVITESVEEFVAEGRELVAAGNATGAGGAVGPRASGETPEAGGAGAAFFGFVTRVVEHASLNRALCEALAQRVVEHASLNRALCEALAREAPDGSPPETAPDARREYGRILATLLERAQAAGAVRPDVTPAEVQALLVGCAAMEQRQERERRPKGPGGGGARAGAGAGIRAGVLTAVMCDGLRAEPASVTEPGDETLGEAAGRRLGPQPCGMCGAPVPTARTGRPARFCGAACRQKAHRRRARGRS
ncbi:helix-turn-helix domain-containing protein [Streptomyces axinellae]